MDSHNPKKYLSFFNKVKGDREKFVAILMNRFGMKYTSARRRHREIVKYLREQKSNVRVVCKPKIQKEKIIKPKKIKAKAEAPKVVPKIEVLMVNIPPVFKIDEKKPKEILVQSFMEFSPDMIEEPPAQKKLLFKDMINYKMRITKELLLRHGFNGLQINWLLKNGWMKEWKLVKELEEENQIMAGSASNPTSA